MTRRTNWWHLIHQRLLLRRIWSFRTIVLQTQSIGIQLFYTSDPGLYWSWWWSTTYRALVCPSYWSQEPGRKCKKEYDILVSEMGINFTFWSHTTETWKVCIWIPWQINNAKYYFFPFSYLYPVLDSSFYDHEHPSTKARIKDQNDK